MPPPTPQATGYQTPDYTLLSSIKRLDHSLLVLRVDRPRPHAFSEPENTLDHTQLRRRCIQTRHRHPIIDHHASAHHTTPAIDTSCHQWHLQQTAQFVLILDACLWMDNPALIAQGHIASHQYIIGNCLPKDLHAKDVGDDFLSLTFYVGVHQGDVVVSTDDVAEGGEALFNPLDFDGIWDRIA